MGPPSHRQVPVYEGSPTTHHRAEGRVISRWSCSTAPCIFCTCHSDATRAFSSHHLHRVLQGLDAHVVGRVVVSWPPDKGFNATTPWRPKLHPMALKETCV